MTNEKMLRETIRLILESQGQTTSRVDPATTSPSFRPFSLVPGLVIAAGVAGLQQIHDWVGGLCAAPNPELSSFPIKLSRKYADLLARSRRSSGTAPIDETTWKRYQDAIAPAGNPSKVPPQSNVDDTNSDLANLTALYAEIKAADDAWLSSATVFGQVGDGSALVSALNKMYNRFSGCVTAFDAQKFPLEINTREQYREFLRDIALLSHNSFISGMSGQRSDLYRVNDSTHKVNDVIGAALSVEQSAYDTLSGTLGSKKR